MHITEEVFCSLTALGRAMIANSLIYSRFRYAAGTIAVPADINQAIEEDVQALIWNKDPTFEADNRGTDRVNKRWLLEAAQTHSLRQLGIGLLPWRAHLKAMQIKMLLGYLDGTRDAYKQVLDCWFARHPEGRGAILSTMPIKQLTKSTTQRVCALPALFTQALASLRELRPEPRRVQGCASQDEAKAEYLWYSLRFKPHSRRFECLWRHLNGRRIGDTIDHGRLPPKFWHEKRIADYIRSGVRTEGDPHGNNDLCVDKGGNALCTVGHLVEDWRRLLLAIPLHI